VVQKQTKKTPITMQFTRPDADIYIPDGKTAPEAALSRVTHLCVAAHQDDIEIMAHAGIVDCLEEPQALAFGGVVVTNGAGSSRIGPYAHYTDAQMQDVRREEQRKAAALGQYAIQLQLRHTSADVKQSANANVAADLRQIFSGCRS